LEKPLHVYKKSTFKGLIFEDAALRVGDPILDPDFGNGVLKKVFYEGNNDCALVTYVDCGDRLVQRADLNLTENGWLAGPFDSGSDKRKRLDTELRDALSKEFWKKQRKNYQWMLQEFHR
jgi:hypothetical protein